MDICRNCPRGKTENIFHIAPKKPDIKAVELQADGKVGLIIGELIKAPNEFLGFDSVTQRRFGKKRKERFSESARFKISRAARSDGRAKAEAFSRTGTDQGLQMRHLRQ